jgi:predicted site-specific integrase-resolvase
MYYKLSDYAKKFNVTYRTAWNRFKKGKIDGAFIDETNHVLIPINKFENKNKVIIYSRVSNSDRKDNLDRQSERLYNYAINNGYTIIDNIKEVGSGLNDNRTKLIKLLKRKDYDILLVENKDRLTRFGFNYIETLLNNNDKEIIVVNKTDDDKTDLIQDLVSIIYSFSARMYGLRRKKNKQEIIDFLEKNDIN